MANKNFEIDELEGLHRPIRRRLEKVISILRENPSASYEDIARITRTSRKTAERDLSKLKGTGILIKRGNTRSTVWLIDENKAEEGRRFLA